MVNVLSRVRSRPRGGCGGWKRRGCAAVRPTYGSRWSSEVRGAGGVRAYGRALAVTGPYLIHESVLHDLLSHLFTWLLTYEGPVCPG